MAERNSVPIGSAKFGHHDLQSAQQRVAGFERRFDQVKRVRQVAWRRP